MGNDIEVGDHVGVPGKSPGYRQGKWLWLPVVVTSYDAEKQRYCVAFADNGQVKMVKR